MNTVGTFGVASASYYWSRVAGSIGRLLQYLSGHSSTSWHMLVADDYLLESGGPGYRIGLLPFFVLCAIVGVPLSWHKTCGWVGGGGGRGEETRSYGWASRFSCDPIVLAFLRGARRFVRWAEKVASSTTIHMASFEEGLGRTISAKIITVLTRYRPIVLELILNCNDCNFPRRRVFGINLKL